MNQHDDAGDDIPEELRQHLAEVENEGFAEFLDLPDSPTWAGIGLFFALVLLFGAAAWGNAALQTGRLQGHYTGTILTAAFSGGMFAVAATGWAWFNMSWHRLYYRARTVCCVLGILLTALSLAWIPLGWK
jgi:hypothetical protein